MTDLLYTDDEESLRDSVRAALRYLDPMAIAGMADDPDADMTHVWRALTDIGAPGLLVPEEHGGVGASAREAAVVLEELGRAVAPAPYLTSSVIATTALLTAGATDDLPALAEGSRTAVLVLPWPASRADWHPADGAGGPVTPVAGAIGAEVFLVPVRQGDGVVLRRLTAEEVSVEPVVSLDPSRPLATVTPTGEGTVLAEGDAAVAAIEAGLAAGTALLASEQYGLARWCLEATVDYGKVRIQFARPIGSFQAIKHRLADLFTEVVQAQAAARYAAGTLADGDPDAPVAQAVAQAYCSDVAVHAAEEALQLHGGIGMTWEHPVHLRLKRAKSDQLALGVPDRHREDLADLVDLPL